MTLTHAVKEHNFLASLPAFQAEKLLALATEVQFKENELILTAHEQSRDFYLLLEGTVCVEVSTRAYSVCIQALGPGEAFGWTSLLNQHDTLFQVRARDNCRALKITASDLSAAFEADPVLAREVLRRALALAADRVAATEARLAELCGVPSRKHRGHAR